MTPRMPGLDNFDILCFDYRKLARDKDQYSVDEARIPKKYQTVRQELALPLADISLPTANMDMKLI